MITTDDLKKHAPTAGISAAVAIAATIALRPSAPSPSPIPGIPDQTFVHASAAHPGTCKLQSGTYPSLDGIDADECVIRYADAAGARNTCGDDRSHFIVEHLKGALVVIFNCALAEEQ